MTNARGIVETTLANGTRVGDLTHDDAKRVLAALMAAADVEPGGDLVIHHGDDWALGRLLGDPACSCSFNIAAASPDVVLGLLAIADAAKNYAWYSNRKNWRQRHEALKAALEAVYPPPGELPPWDEAAP